MLEERHYRRTGRRAAAPRARFHASGEVSALATSFLPHRGLQRRRLMLARCADARGAEKGRHSETRLMMLTPHGAASAIFFMPRCIPRPLRREAPDRCDIQRQQAELRRHAARHVPAAFTPKKYRSRRASLRLSHFIQNRAGHARCCRFRQSRQLPRKKMRRHGQCYRATLKTRPFSPACCCVRSIFSASMTPHFHALGMESFRASISLRQMVK